MMMRSFQLVVTISLFALFYAQQLGNIFQQSLIVGDASRNIQSTSDSQLQTTESHLSVRELIESFKRSKLSEQETDGSLDFQWVDSLISTDNEILSILVRLSDQIDILSNPRHDILLQNDGATSEIPSIDQLEQKLSKFSIHLQDLHDQRELSIRELEKKVQSFMVESNEKQRKCDENVEFTNASINDIKRSQIKDIEDMKRELAPKMMGLESQQENVLDQIRQLHIIIENKVNIMKDYQSQITSFETNYKAMELALARINSELKSIVDQSSSAHIELMGYFDQINLEGHNLYKTCHDLMGTISSNISTEIIILQRSIQDIEERSATNVEAVRDEFIRIVDSLKTTLQPIIDESDSLHAAVADVQSQFDKVTSEFHQVRGRSHSIEIAIGRLESELKNIDLLVDRNFLYLQESFQGNRKNLENDLQTLTTSLQEHIHVDLIQSHDDIRSSFKVIEDKMNLFYQRLEEEIVSRELRHQEYEVTLTSCTNELAYLRLSLTEQGKAINHFSTGLSTSLDIVKLGLNEAERKLSMVDDKQAIEMQKFEARLLMFQDEVSQSISNAVGENDSMMKNSISAVDQKMMMEVEALRRQLYLQQETIDHILGKQKEERETRDQLIDDLKLQLLSYQQENKVLHDEVNIISIKMELMTQRIQDITTEQNNHPLKVIKKKMQPIFQKVVSKLAKLGTRLIPKEMRALPFSKDVKIAGAIAIATQEKISHQS